MENSPLFHICSAILFAAMGIFMHLLIVEMRKAYYLKWPSDAETIVSMYFIGMIPAVAGIVFALYYAFSYCTPAL